MATVVGVGQDGGMADVSLDVKEPESGTSSSGEMTVDMMTEQVLKGTELAFRGITVEVQRTDPNKPLLSLPATRRQKAELGMKKILDDVSGVFRPGELVYIMAPSGGGKSTLLDTLASRMAQKMSGSIYVNRALKDETAFKRVAKYVQQEDNLYEMLTAREALEFAHDFFRGLKERARRTERVDNMLKTLGLIEQAEVRTGGLLFKGLSGGQRRRLSVGEALISVPQILFLDEPTSGLDASSAFYLMKFLKSVAHRNNLCVVATIHQPSEEIFDFADQLMLLSAGQVAYCGPSHDVKQHMESSAVGLTMPVDMSLAEWLLFIINSDFEDAKESKQKVLNGWKGSAAHRELERTLDEIEETAGTARTDEVGMHVSVANMMSNQVPKDVYACSWFEQAWILSKRGFLNVARDPAVVWVRLILYLGLAFCISTAWVQLPRTAAQFFDWVSVMAYTNGFYIFMTIAAVPAQFIEKGIVIKERANGAYGTSAYVWSRGFVDVPFLAVMVVLCVSMIYWVVGFTADAGRYFFTLLAFLCGFLAGESLTFFVSAVTPFYLLAILLVAFIYGSFMTVMGVMIRLSEIGWWLRWLQYLSLQFYLNMSVMVNEFTGNTYAASPDVIPPQLESSGEQFLAVLGIDGWNKWIGIGVLVAYAIVYRILASIWIYKFHTGKK
ncbi:ABC transporter G family member 12 [Porphyridium purpureum]|uniref:Probable ATP-dependent transporter ycf16 n=1 Tax=Porphyridium purpureum TaxID=35688 RepID=A0A5J4YPG1_PORPP|nr:ABC transporter G family member 12 [Porphyridium purpureum]|eukprot:POR0498..scf296_7